MRFAEKMIELRKRQGLSQQDLADQLGVSRQAISRWETGAVQPQADNVKSLAQVFRVSADFLLDDSLDESAPPQGEPKPASPRRRWRLALAALAAAALLVLVTAVGTAYYLRWEETRPVPAHDMLMEDDDGQPDGTFAVSW